MKRFLLPLLVGVASCGAAQDVARATPPRVEVLWELLGSVATVDVEVGSPDVRSVLFVSMYGGEAVVAGSQAVAAEADPVLTISAGALKPGTRSAGCEGGMHVFLHHRAVTAHGGGAGMIQRCVDVGGLINVTDHFGSGPLNRPPQHQGEQALPVDTWLLFGATDLFTEQGAASETDIDTFLTHWFLLSTDAIIPPSDRWELPAYEDWWHAYEAFGVH